MYLEGMEEASIFVHVAVSDISGKVSATCGATCLSTPGPSPAMLLGFGALQLPCGGCSSILRVGGGDPLTPVSCGCCRRPRAAPPP